MLPIVNKKQTYDRVYFDIVGMCNAKCRFCVTGTSNHPKGGIVDVEQLEKSIDVLFANNLIKNESVFSLFNWGEPTLHPQLGKILEILQKKNLRYILSTNAGRYIEYKPGWFKNLDGLTISMCGFSQESYDKIHKFDFEKVKSNIVSLVQVAGKAGYYTPNITIAHHIYQFNTHEIPMLQKFAEQLNISYNPYYAFINDWKVFEQYIDNTLEAQVLKDISQNIFCYFIQKRLDNHPRNACRQFDVLNIDEKFNILPCCCLPRDHQDYVFTNIFAEDLAERLSNWQPTETCVNCMAKGMSPLPDVGDSFPVFVQPELAFLRRVYNVAKALKKKMIGMIRHKR